MTRENIYKVFSNIPTLETERLILRSMHPMDADDMFDYAGREDVTRYLLWSPHPSPSYTEDYLKYIQSRYALGDFFDWAVVHRESGKMIGTCGFTKINAENNYGEIGYVINPDFRGMEYAAEAAKRVIEFGFEELGLHRIEARFMKGNEASLRVMEKLGMSFEGYLKDAIYVKGSYRTVGVCAIVGKTTIK